MNFVEKIGVASCSWQAFERMLARLLICDGYQNVRQVGGSGDHGADVIATKYNKLEDKDGLTADQRFFHAYAGVWAGNITEAEIRNRTKSDPHSLGRFRVNGALPHIDAWYEAFGVKEGDKLFIPKKERLDLW